MSKKLKLSRFICPALSIFLIAFSSGQALALSTDQKDVFDSGVYYFNTAPGTQPSGNACSFGNGTLPGVVPAPYNGIFSAAAGKYNIDPAFLAAIFYGGEHGNSFPDPPPPYGHGAPWKTSSSGAEGPFQFEPNTWPSYAEDGNGDGVEDVQDLSDASFAAAHYLADLGAKNSTDETTLRTVAWKYNEGPAGNPSPNGDYANNVWAAYQQFSGAAPAGSGAAASSGSCASGSVTAAGITQNGSFGTGDGLMGHQPTMIGLHYTAGNEQTVQDVINDLQDPTGAKHCNHITHTCSVQLTVLPDGSVYQLTSRLDVITENIINFNDADIGIEIAGENEQALLANQTQFNSVVSLVTQLMQQYNIKMEQDFSNKAGLMGHMECDAWSQAHIGDSFTGQYSGDTVASTDNHQDPGPSYMAKVRQAVGQALGQ